MVSIPRKSIWSWSLSNIVFIQLGSGLGWYGFKIKLLSTTSTMISLNGFYRFLKSSKSWKSWSNYSYILLSWESENGLLSFKLSPTF